MPTGLTMSTWASLVDQSHPKSEQDWARSCDSHGYSGETKRWRSRSTCNTDTGMWMHGEPGSKGKWRLNGASPSPGDPDRKPNLQREALGELKPLHK